MAMLWLLSWSKFNYKITLEVLNTDNMSILGLTIDFGPYGWMDYFDKGYICNHSDEHGRYSYENQPEICKWNLKKLAEAIAPVVDEKTTQGYLEENYHRLYKETFYGLMRRKVLIFNTLINRKLGLISASSTKDEELIDDLFNVMHLNASDFTNTFRSLSSVPIPTTLLKATADESTFFDQSCNI